MGELNPRDSVFIMADLAIRAIGIIHAAECAARKKYWIGGVPTSQDLHAVAVHVAKQLKTTPELVQATVAVQGGRQ